MQKSIPAEGFKPISVKPPSSSPLAFRLRTLVDLQLATIVSQLQPAMSALEGEVLDVGAGESPWREWLPSHCRYLGIDIDNAGDYGMRRARPDIVYYDGGAMPLADARFDGMLCIEVLEHARDPEALMAEMARVLKPGGVLLLSVPFSARRHHVPFDFHRFTRERLQILLADHGFRDVRLDERGNDVGAIASKLVVLTLRQLKPRKLWHALWSLPLALLLVPVTVAMLAAAHVSDALGMGSREDPLGYFVRAVRG